MNNATTFAPNTISLEEKQRRLKAFVSIHVILCQTHLVESKLFNTADMVNLFYTDSELKEMGYADVAIPRYSGDDCKEIYEWWVVSDWLEKRLEEQGEPILKTEYGSWWGRTCTGQAIYLDSVIEAIYDATCR